MTKIYDRVRAIVPATPNQNRFSLWLSAILMTVSFSANALWIQNAVTTPQTCSQQGSLSFSIMDGTPPSYAHVTVIDVSGREVETLFKGMAQTDTLYEFGLDQESYAAGSYTLRVVVGDTVYSQRMMVLDTGSR